MKLARPGAIALSVIALAAASGPAIAKAATPQAPRAATTSVAVYDCGNKPLIEPHTFVFTCDSTGSLTKLQWSAWNSTMATATGVLNTDNCVPNCASGKWTHQQADVILWRSAAVKGYPGKRGYTEMTFLLPGGAINSHDTETRTPPGKFPGES
jgi:hypothetical protein